MLKDLLPLQKLKLIFKQYKTENKEIWDIIIYGSSARGNQKARDVDIAIILKDKTKLEKKLQLAQKLKTKLKQINKQFDVKTVDIADFLDKTFMARQAILAEGYSVMNKSYISGLLGFKPYSLFTYSMGKLNNSQKKMFHYALKGRRGQEGLLKKLKAESIGKGVIKIPLENTQELKDVLQKHKIAFETKIILSYNF